MPKESPNEEYDTLPRGTKNDRVFRVLLNNPRGNLTKYRVAKLAGAQQIQVTKLLRQLEHLKLVRDTLVTNYQGLIKEWARRIVKFQAQRYMLQDIMNLLKRTRLEYALTTYQAETLVNHYLFPTKTEFYIHKDDFEKWHGIFLRRGALVGGGNVTIRLYDDGVFYNSFTVKDYKVVSIPQIIVDLLREGGVAVQAAKMMIGKYAETKQARKRRPR